MAGKATVGLRPLTTWRELLQLCLTFVGHQWRGVGVRLWAPGAVLLRGQIGLAQEAVDRDRGGHSENWNPTATDKRKG